MPAYIHRWTKTRDKSGEQSYECRAYDVEIVAPEPDMSEAANQLRHANEQLAISRQYPGRDQPTLPRAPRLRVME
jgi:hypothetical protein